MQVGKDFVAMHIFFIVNLHRKIFFPLLFSRSVRKGREEWGKRKRM